MNKFIEITDTIGQSLIINVDRIILIVPRDSDINVDTCIFYDAKDETQTIEISKEEYLRLIEFMKVDHQ